MASNDRGERLLTEQAMQFGQERFDTFRENCKNESFWKTSRFVSFTIVLTILLFIMYVSSRTHFYILLAGIIVSGGLYYVFNIVSPTYDQSPMFPSLNSMTNLAKASFTGDTYPGGAPNESYNMSSQNYP